MNQVKHNRAAEVESNLENSEQSHLSLTDQEALSALMDGELGEFELRRLLTRIADSPELLLTWERYNLARAVFEPEPLDLHTLTESTYTDASSTLLARIMLAVEQEPLPSHKSGTTHPSSKPHIKPWHRDLARLAIAASVALAVFVGMQSLMTSSSIQPEIADTGSAATSIDQELTGSDERQNVQLAVDEEAQQRLNDYIRSVSIPGRADSSAPFNILEESAMLRPVSDRELIQEIERKSP